MSFWDSELGPITGSTDDAFVKSFSVIPDGTMALASIDYIVSKDLPESQFSEAERIYEIK